MSDRLVRALDDPLRRRLLHAYSVEAVNPATVAERLGLPVNRIAYHTGVLEKHGFVERVRTERRRGALTRFYRTTVPLSLDGEDWESVAVEDRRALVLGALEEALTQARRGATEGAFERPDAHLTRTPLSLDAEGVSEAVELLRAAMERIDAIVADCRGRRPPMIHTREVMVFAYEHHPGGA